MPDNQNNRADYTLKQTKEYEALDADIDKDNEQLSKRDFPKLCVTAYNP